MGPADLRSTMNQSVYPDDRSQMSNSKGLAHNLHLEKEKILKIEDYTEAFLDTVKKKYEEMEQCYQ